MKAALLLALFLLPSSPILGQTTAPDHATLELVALARPGYLLGAQAEYAAVDHVAPWVSLRYGTHNPYCELGHFGSDCGASGLSALAGVRLKAGPWGPVEPYITLGVGRLWWDEGEVEARADDVELTGTAHVGVAWTGFGRIRPRIEFGYESHINPWMNVGVGFVP